MVQKINGIFFYLKYFETPDERLQVDFLINSPNWILQCIEGKFIKLKDKVFWNISDNYYKYFKKK